ncbi:DUF4435 domain-containing protein [Moraxella sp. 179-F 1C4 NHS]|jgi:hypothetical protein
MVDIPERSFEGNFAKSVFYTEYNDIDIYVEDTKRGYEKIFKILFSRLFEGKFRVDNIFPLGGRDKVINKFKQEISSRPLLYVIDGDLMFLTKNDVQNTKGFFRLPCYCLENILCDVNALVNILDDEDSNKTYIEIVKDFDYNDWLVKNEEKLFELFIEYKVAKILYPELATVSFDVTYLLSCNRGVLEENKFQQRIQFVKNSVITIAGYSQYISTRNEVVEEFNNSLANKLSIVSGKDYILPLLKKRAQSSAKMNITNPSLMNRLAKNCDLTLLQDAINYVG